MVIRFEEVLIDDVPPLPPLIAGSWYNGGQTLHCEQGYNREYDICTMSCHQWNVSFINASMVIIAVRSFLKYFLQFFLASILFLLSCEKCTLYITFGSFWITSTSWKQPDLHIKVKRNMNPSKAITSSQHININILPRFSQCPTGQVIWLVKLPIRLSSLRSDSVDIGGVCQIWKSNGWRSYVFYMYKHTFREG